MLRSRKPVVAVYARGGDYSPQQEQMVDFQKRYLELILGFIGLTDLRSVVCMPTLSGREIGARGLVFHAGSAVDERQELLPDGQWGPAQQVSASPGGGAYAPWAVTGPTPGRIFTGLSARKAWASCSVRATERPAMSTHALTDGVLRDDDALVLLHRPT